MHPPALSIDQFELVTKWSVKTLAIVIGALLGINGANAGVNELVLQLDTSMRQDSNPLRLGSDLNPQTTLGSPKRSDAIGAIEVRAGLIHTFDSPDTRLLLSGSLGQTDYRTLNQFDNTTEAYSGKFEWRLSELWRGKLSSSEEQSQYIPYDGSFAQKAALNNSTHGAEVSLRITPDLELPVGIIRTRQTYDNVGLQSSNRTSNAIEAGLQIRSATFSSARISVRTTKTNFDQRNIDQIAVLDTGFRDNEIYANGEWQYSIKTRFSGRLGALQRSYQTLSARNFSVLNTELRADYDHSPLTRFSAEVWNRPFGSTDQNTLYSIVTGAGLSALWRASPKTGIRVSIAEDIFRNKPSVLGAALVNAEIQRTRISARATHAFTRELLFYVDGFTERLNRGPTLSSISQTSLKLGFEYTFENLTGVAQRLSMGQQKP